MRNVVLAAWVIGFLLAHKGAPAPSWSWQTVGEGLCIVAVGAFWRAAGDSDNG